MADERDAQDSPDAELRRAWADAPPAPELRSFLTPDVLADESRLRELVHLDALERHRLGEDARLEHYQSLLEHLSPQALAPGSELARLLIRLELLMSGESGGPDRLESLRQRLGAGMPAM